MRREHLGLWVAALLFLGLRAAILYTDFDSVAMVSYELYPMGTLPAILLEGGIDIPLSCYYDNAGGQLVTGLAAVPLYALLGQTYLALKLVPLLTGLGALIVIWFFLHSAFGQRAAWIGSLLFALAPASLVKYSLKASGNHYENLFFTLLAMWCLWRVHAGGRRTLRLWAAGYSMGLALLVFLGAIIPLGLLALTHLGLVGWRRALRDALHVVPAMLLGALPLILLNARTQARGAGFLAAKFSGQGGGFEPRRVAARWVEFFGVHLPDSMTYPDLAGLPGRVAGGIFLGLFAVALAAVLPEVLRACAALARGACARGVAAERDPARDLGRLQAFVLAPLVLYLPLTALAYGLSDLRMGGYSPPLQDGGYRYYLPTLTFACLLIAVVAARWLAQPRLRATGVLAVALALFGGSFDLGLVDASLQRAGRGTHYEGHYMKQVSRSLLAPKQGFEASEIVRRSAAFPPVYRARIYEGLGFYSGLLAGMRGTLDQLEPEHLTAPWPTGQHADVLRGVGSSLRRPLLDAAQRSQVLGLLARLHSQDPRSAGELVAGLAFEWEVVLASGTQADQALTLELLALLPDSLRPELARGLGIASGRILRRGIAVEAGWVAELPGRLPTDCETAFAAGLGLGLADGARDAGWPQAFELGALPPQALFAALDERLVALHGSAAAAQRERVATALPPGLRARWSARGEAGQPRE